jgi:hypothetical protein
MAIYFIIIMAILYPIGYLLMIMGYKKRIKKLNNKLSSLVDTSKCESSTEAPTKYGCGSIKVKALPEWADDSVEYILHFTFKLIKEFGDRYEVKIMDITGCSTEEDIRGEAHIRYKSYLYRMYNKSTILVNKENTQLELEVPDIIINENNLGELLNNQQININGVKIKLENSYDYEEIFQLVVKYMK